MRMNYKFFTANLTKMEIDLQKIKHLGLERERENMEFRSFLKGKSSGKTDSIVHRLYEQVSTEIDCKECGNCCIEMLPILKKSDIKKLSEAVNLSSQQFNEQYTKTDEDEDRIFNREPCPFLKNKLCTQYDSRPSDCASFPHLHKKDFTSRLFNVISNYERCPIVFNVYELLKQEMKFLR